MLYEKLWPSLKIKAFSSPKSQFHTIRIDPKPVNNLFTVFPLSQTKKISRKKKVTLCYCDRGQR